MAVWRYPGHRVVILISFLVLLGPATIKKEFSLDEYFAEPNKIQRFGLNITVSYKMTKESTYRLE